MCEARTRLPCPKKHAHPHLSVVAALGGLGSLQHDCNSGEVSLHWCDAPALLPATCDHAWPCLYCRPPPEGSKGLRLRRGRAVVPRYFVQHVVAMVSDAPGSESVQGSQLVEENWASMPAVPVLVPVCRVVFGMQVCFLLLTAVLYAFKQIHNYRVSGGPGRSDLVGGCPKPGCWPAWCTVLHSACSPLLGGGCKAAGRGGGRQAVPPAGGSQHPGLWAGVPTAQRLATPWCSSTACASNNSWGRSRRRLPPPPPAVERMPWG